MNPMNPLKITMGMKVFGRLVVSQKLAPRRFSWAESPWMYSTWQIRNHSCWKCLATAVTQFVLRNAYSNCHFTRKGLVHLNSNIVFFCAVFKNDIEEFSGHFSRSCTKTSKSSTPPKTERSALSDERCCFHTCWVTEAAALFWGPLSCRSLRGCTSSHGLKSTGGVITVAIADHAGADQQDWILQLIDSFSPNSIEILWKTLWIFGCVDCSPNCFQPETCKVMNTLLKAFEFGTLLQVGIVDLSGSRQLFALWAEKRNLRV